MSDRRSVSGFLLAIASALVVLLASPAAARQAATIGISGGVQLRATAGNSGSLEQDRLGFGIRRARLKFNAQLSKGPGAFVQVDGAGGELSVLDFFVFYDLSPGLRIRAGRLISAQPRAFIRTGMNQIDGVDRPAVAESWGRATLGGDGRDFGVDARFRRGAIEAILFVHNGDGSWDRQRGNYRESLSGGTATGGMDRTRLAVSGALTVSPAAVSGLELGIFGGFNPVEGPNTAVGGIGRTYATFGGHAYFGASPGSQRIRLKADVVGITFEALPGGETQQSLGISLFGALGMSRHAEVYVRTEALEADLNGSDDADGFFSAGLSFSPSARRGGAYHAERITLDYGRFKGGQLLAEAENLLTLQLQLAF